ncbi:MAG TPA: alanine racemase, partial [Thermoleophilia bacterium]|nr:alanine racemase [Thermoleophilia bacterium]
GSRPDEAAATVRLADVSLNSELETVVALDAAAARLGGVHRVIVMVDLGDLREGVLPEEVVPFLKGVLSLRHVSLEGLGTNLSCYGGIVPSPQNLGQLVELEQIAEEMAGRRLTVSGGNSGTLGLALSGGMPAGIDNLRLGESILLGTNTLTREQLTPELEVDAFTISAPVIECRMKPSVPFGDIAQDAFGGRPTFVDRGLRMRALCALGRQDAPPQGLTPHDPLVEVLGASSDHLVLDVDDMDVPPEPGDTIEFRPNYAALLQAYTSPYVQKVHLRAGSVVAGNRARARREGAP